MQGWSEFFLGELGAAAALAGMLFVAISVNQARILALGRMADRGLEAMIMLFLDIVVASLPLVPGQPIRLLGGEIAVIAAATLVGLARLQYGYLAAIEPEHRRPASRMVWVNRTAVALIVTGGLVSLVLGDVTGAYLLVVGILLSFIAVGANAWVLLIEINR